jgi:processive 1,2-diacylglycerol beta-glucosyltransferase
MSRRILILSASVGAGHLRAAQAVEAALRLLDPDAEVENLDVLELTNVAFRRFYGRAYLDLVNRAPHVLGYFYDRLDRPPSPRRKGDRLRMLVERLNLQKFLHRLREGAWDIVVNTHFLPAEMIAMLRRQGELAMPHLTVTTDFETHRLWVNQPCEHYFTATEEGARNLHHWGVPETDTTVTGIPVDPAFSQSKDRQECLIRLGLSGKGDSPIFADHASMVPGKSGQSPRPTGAHLLGQHDRLRRTVDPLFDHYGRRFRPCAAARADCVA